MSEVLWIVDRIEGDLAIVSGAGVGFEVPVAALPEGVSEGDFVRLALDPAARAEARQTAASRLAALVDDDGGDFEL